MNYSYDYREAARPIPLDRSVVQELVKDILRELPQHLKFRSPLEKPLWAQRGFNPNSWGFSLKNSWGFDLKLKETDVRGHPVVVKVLVKATEGLGFPEGPRKFVISGAIRAQYFPNSKGSPSGYGVKTELVITLNSARSPQEFQEGSLLAKELSSVISHELTHLRDLLRYKGPVEDSDAGVADYYNRPTEVRAFMRQVSDEVVDYAHSVGKDDPFFLSLDRHFIDKALSKSDTWNRVQEFLTVSNLRLMLRGVTRALQDEWPKLRELYSQEENEY